MRYFLAPLLALLIASCSSGNKNPPAGARNERPVYLAPLGDVRGGTLQALVEHYRRKFGVEFQLLSPMQLDSHDYDPGRKQFVAESLIRRMQERYSSLASNPKNIVIGITDSDIYTLGENWRFCFGWRAFDAHMAVVSTARLNIHYLGQPLFGTSPQARLQKIVTKDLGILYFGRSPSNDPRSVLYNKILGIQELDRVSEDF